MPHLCTSQLIQLVDLLLGTCCCGTVSALIGALATIFALYSACQARRAAEATLQDTRAGLVARLLNDYEGMAEALDELKVLKEKDAQKDIEVHASELKKGDAEKWRKLDHARRKVSHYYRRVCIFYALGTLDKDLVKQVASSDQVKDFIHVNEPLEYVTNPRYDVSCFDTLAGLFGIDYAPYRERQSQTDPE